MNNEFPNLIVTPIRLVMENHAILLVKYVRSFTAINHFSIQSSPLKGIRT